MVRFIQNSDFPHDIATVTSIVNGPYNAGASTTDRGDIPMVTLPPFPSLTSFHPSHPKETEKNRKESCGILNNSFDVNTPFNRVIQKDSAKECRLKSDPNAPKKPFQPYIYFSNSIRDAIKNEKPDISFSDLGKEMGRRFKALSPEEHQYWKDVATQEKEAYERALEAYQSNVMATNWSSSVENPAYVGSKTKPKKTDPNAPRKPYSAYIRFSNSVRETVKQQHPEMSPNDVSREVAKRFKELPSEERNYLDSIVKKDMENYRQMLENYTLIAESAKMEAPLPTQFTSSSSPFSGSKSDQKFYIKAKKKRFIDPNAPKKPYTAYIYFSNNIREDIKQQNPDFSFTDIAREMGRRFKQLNPEEKKYWQEVAAREKERYDRELEAYNAHSGQHISATVREILPIEEGQDEAPSTQLAGAILPI